MSNDQRIRKIPYTGVVDFGKFKMRVAVTDYKESVIFSDELTKILGVDCLQYIQQDRFTPYRTEEMINGLKSPLSIKRNDGKIEYAYQADILADFFCTVVAAKESGILEGEQDEKIFHTCKIIVDKLIPKGLEIYNKWLNKVQNN